MKTDLICDQLRCAFNFVAVSLFILWKVTRQLFSTFGVQENQAQDYTAYSLPDILVLHDGVN